MLRGDAIYSIAAWVEDAFLISCLMMLWQSSTQDLQIYTSRGPSTMGPASRWLLPQKLQVLVRRERPLPPPPPLPPLRLDAISFSSAGPVRVPGMPRDANPNIRMDARSLVIYIIGRSIFMLK